ncbi:hypothetical protein [Hymenobacter perfusus]|uniref:Uncharacterized protein n=1 Tax=Hymenobacter perfusus TaxID=1236770 RepID=A0A3R9NYJ1_9BACT|nr:hypothetical protein [Hymenobacter perfusus]RSK46330.1 hypothetical protein EI293_03945 [Hymenobacter perfusus]
MAAPIVQEFTFARQAPAIDEVVNDLITVSGLLIEFDTHPGGSEGSTMWQIRALSVPMKLVIVSTDKDVPAYIIGYDPFSKRAPYLAGTLQWVFSQKGGFCEGEMPEWAGLRWTDVRKTWNLG